MKIAIGCDHRGVDHKNLIIDELVTLGHELIDCGRDGSALADYPDPAFAVGNNIAEKKCDCGVLICGSGIGVSIASNKVQGVRAALCWTVEMSKTTRQHNDSNVICFSGDYSSPGQALEMTLAWLDSDFEGGRHSRRVQKIIDFETGSK